MCLIRGGLFFGGILALLSLCTVEAKLMGKGLGIGALSGQSRRPWDRINHGRPWGKSRHPYDNAAEDPSGTYYYSYGNTDTQSARNRPCVGACYYEKLLGLNAKTKAEKIPNETIQDEVLYEEPAPAPLQTMPISAGPEKTVRKKPCVGICQYYRSLGLENPYEKRGKLMV